MRKAQNLVCGVGVNDSDYQTSKLLNGKYVKCKYFQTWQGMIERCYSEKFQLRNPSYIGCTVDSSWFSFMQFKAWMKDQHFEGMRLDKDILKPGNMIYSKENCAFVTELTNNFVVDRGAARRGDLVGASWCKNRKKYFCLISNPFTGKNEFLGRFNTALESNMAWKNRKHQLACQLAELQTDERVAKALMLRYAK